MKKNIKITAGKSAEIILDSAKDQDVFIEVGKFCTVSVLTIRRVADDFNLQLRVNLVGKKSAVNIHSLIVGSIGKKTINEIEINHLARETSSSFIGYALMQNNAEHIWGVTTVIEKAAKKSRASQKINNLLFGELGVVKNRPALVIKNNDVICSHAVATGHLDEEQLFYAQARGVTLKQSKELLTQAFVAPILKLWPKIAI